MRLTIAKRIWWGAWKGKREAAHCKCWGGRERSQAAHQFAELTKRPHPTGCWKHTSLTQTGVCLFASVGALSVSRRRVGHSDIAEYNPCFLPSRMLCQSLFGH